jgi:hypothetical protein
MLVCWFSCGVSSCVAAALTPDATLIRIAIRDEHQDNERFVAEVQPVLKRSVYTLMSPWESVERVIRGQKYVNGPTGAPCTRILKRTVRELWERENPGEHTYVWGFDCDEKQRFDRLDRSVHHHVAPLIERGITKADAHGVFRALFPRVSVPAMYDLGFANNNCIGCVKGGKGYWNKVREHFPAVFAARARLEREIGHSCIRGRFLDELQPHEGLADPISPTCGLACVGAFVDFYSS